VLSCTLPSKFQKDSVAGTTATVTPWRQFFSDPALASLIDTALVNNQDLRMTHPADSYSEKWCALSEGQ
jgi:outer membrane protein TolC